MLYPFSFMLLDNNSPPQQEEETTTTTTEDPSPSTTTTTEEPTTTTAEPLPYCDVAPVISGSAFSGQILTLDSIGVWSGAAPGYSIQWYNQHGMIGAQDGSTLILGTQNINQYIYVKITRTNPAGSTSANSNTIGPIAEEAVTTTTEEPTTTTTEEPTTTTTEEPTTTTTEEPTTTTTEPPPAYGTPLGGPYCSGFDLVQEQADGNGGQFTAVLEANSETCGYTP